MLGPINKLRSHKAMYKRASSIRHPRAGYAFSRLTHGEFYRAEHFHGAAVVKAVKRKLVVIDLYDTNIVTIQELRFKERSHWFQFMYRYPSWIFFEEKPESFVPLQSWIASQDSITRLPPIER